MSRMAGSDRFATAADVSRSSFSSGVPVAFVATGWSFADALSAGPAAAQLGGPILLTGEELPAVTAEELARLRPARIVVVGGEAAVSAAVAGQLAGFTDGAVDRWGGADRFATSALVSAEVFEPGAPVFVATGAGFPDALAGGVAAGVAGGPVLLSGDGVLDQGIAAEIERLAPEQVTILGGEEAVAESVERHLATLSGDVRRWTGEDRFATAAAVATGQFPEGADTVFVATGAHFADALAGVPVAAGAEAPILLVTSGDVPTATGAALDALAPSTIVILGGETAVGAEVMAALDGHRAVDG